MKKPKLRELGEAIKAVFQGPYTSKFPYKPAVVPESYRGKPEFDEEGCVGCAACAEICPADAIEVLDEATKEGGTRRVVLHFDHCIFCGQCQENCLTEEGIKLTNEYDLAVTDRSQAIVSIEKDLLVCEVCGAIISTVEHIRWLAEKLGPQAYANPTFILASYKELELVGETAPRAEKPIGRTDHIRILCPKCRREVVLTEEWGK